MNPEENMFPEEEHAPQEQPHEPGWIDVLELSEETKWIVAHWISRTFGHPVTIYPLRTAPTRTQARNYSDSGDLAVTMGVETKGINYPFTSREDWRFPDRFILCKKSAFDRLFPRPYIYVIVNPPKTHAAFVLCNKSKTWKTEWIKTRPYGERQEFYIVPLEQVVFGRITASG